MEDKIDTLTAYKAMVNFIEAYWERTGKPDTIGSLLGDLNLDTFEDEGPADSAVFSEWQESVRKARNS